MAVWDDLLSQEEHAVVEAFRWSRSLGTRPAILVIDVNYAFVGSRPESILDSMKEFPTSCGKRGWEAVARIESLLDVGREIGAAIIYTTTEVSSVRKALWGRRTRDEPGPWVLEPSELDKAKLGATIVSEIEPQPQDLVLTKEGASAFFGTSLMVWLTNLEIDTLLVVGTTTSGCVRATVVDGACYGLKVAVVEGGCFDRLDISHRASLLDMDLKYGTVLSMADAIDYLRTDAEAVLHDHTRAPSTAPAAAPRSASTPLDGAPR